MLNNKKTITFKLQTQNYRLNHNHSSYWSPSVFHLLLFLFLLLNISFFNFFSFTFSHFDIIIDWSFFLWLLVKISIDHSASHLYVYQKFLSNFSITLVLGKNFSIIAFQSSPYFAIPYANRAPSSLDQQYSLILQLK